MFGELFDRSPYRWGLRGDTYLWQAMRERFAETPMPESEWDVIDLFNAAFKELTGKTLEPGIRNVRVRSFRTGSGISDGWVSGSWWLNVGQVLILDRWAAAMKREF